MVEQAASAASFTALSLASSAQAGGRQSCGNFFPWEVHQALWMIVPLSMHCWMAVLAERTSIPILAVVWRRNKAAAMAFESYTQ